MEFSYKVNFTKDFNGVINVNPAVNQFTSFQQLVETFEDHNDVRSIGAFKIVPPSGSIARSSGYEDLPVLIHNMAFSREQSVLPTGKGFTSLEIPIEIITQRPGKRNRAKALMENKKNIAIRQFQGSGDPSVPFGDFYQIVHQGQKDVSVSATEFWDGIEMRRPYYATGNGSLFQDCTNVFNLNKLDTILQRSAAGYGNYPGITESWIYVGTPGSHFPLHVEDSYLPSVNYLHYGKPKIWYVIPPDESVKVQRLAAEIFSDEFHKCSKFLQHKTSMIPPQVLADYGIKFKEITHNPGEYLVVLPFAYHEGFNEGLNVSEAVNFASRQWIKEYLACFELCPCEKAEGVKIPCNDFFKMKNTRNYEKMCGVMYRKLKSDEGTSCGNAVPEKVRCPKPSTLTKPLGFTIPPRPVSDFLRKEQTVQPASDGRRANVCPYCETLTIQLKTHVLRYHAAELLVKDLIAADAEGKSQEAKSLVKKIRGNGILLFNNSRELNPHGQFMPARRTQNPRDAGEFITCLNCHNSILRNNKRHKCYKEVEMYKDTTVRDRQEISQLMENQFNKHMSQETKALIVKRKQDDVWQIIVKDDVITVLLNNLIGEGLGKQNIMRYGRVLGTIVKEFQDDGGIGQLRDLLSTEREQFLLDLLTDESMPKQKKKDLRTALRHLARVLAIVSVREQVQLTNKQFNFLKLLSGTP